MPEQPTLPTTVVIPTIGRPSLNVLLEKLAADPGPRPSEVIVVDDRRRAGPGATALTLCPALPVRLVRSGGRGPAAARNLGWRLARTPWVSFLDDDVVPGEGWLDGLAADLSAAADDVAGSQGRVIVPLPDDRRPTDWERNTAGLAEAAWITADMSYRRHELVSVGGFDERFPRAFREDADLALRLLARGRRLVRARRYVQHPVRPAGFWVSARAQRGNADDALMTRLHGRDWWDRADAPRGRLRHHLLTCASALASGVAFAAGARRSSRAAAALWVGCTARFAWTRIQPGPRTPAEVCRMVVTSVAIPPLAAWHAVGGRWRHRHAEPWQGIPDLVLFDRDGTLIHDVPYNADPDLVRPVADAQPALEMLRDRGIKVGIVTNQSGVALGRIRPEQAAAVNAEVERQLGPFDVVVMCPHSSDDGCDCRKPAPGLIRAACAQVEVPADRCVMVGDIGSDVQAAARAGARGILVPAPATSDADVLDAAVVMPSLLGAVTEILHQG